MSKLEYNIEWMYGDGEADSETTYKIDESNRDIFEDMLNKVCDHDLDHILGCKEKGIKENSLGKKNKLTSEQLDIFRNIYDEIPDIGGYKESNYVFLVNWNIKK